MPSSADQRFSLPSRDDGRAGTKIVATIGPASEDKIGALIDAGISVARINFSHGTDEDHRRRAEKVRTAARLKGVPIGLLADTQGPKLRLGKLSKPELALARNQVVRLVEAASSTDESVIPFHFTGFNGSLASGDRVLLADGTVELVVQEIGKDEVVARVRRGGKI